MVSLEQQKWTLGGTFMLHVTCGVFHIMAALLNCLKISSRPNIETKVLMSNRPPNQGIESSNV